MNWLASLVLSEAPRKAGTARVPHARAWFAGKQLGALLYFATVSCVGGGATLLDEAPCIELSLYDRSAMGRAFHVRIYGAGRLAVNYGGYQTEPRAIEGLASSELCDRLAEPGRSAGFSEFILSEDEYRRNEGGLPIIVVAPRSGKRFAFLAWHEETQYLTGSEFGAAMGELDRALRAHFHELYCLDDACESTRFGFLTSTGGQ
jgi:hypothetical protein